VIELRQLSIGFPHRHGGVKLAVRDVSLAVAPGERVGIVGESGSGKSLTALACLGLAPEPGRFISGSIVIGGRDLASLTADELRSWRGEKVGLCFQEASSALNPVYTVGFQLAETMACHRGTNRSESRNKARVLLEMVALDPVDRILGAYPHQLSGGQAQRVMLALALAGNPRLLIADEPTSALDAITRSEILGLVERLVEEFGLALLLISHDLEAVRSAVDRILVMYAGEVVEEAATGDVFRDPLHPYTRLLLASVPGVRGDAHPQPPVGSMRPDTGGSHGCSFAPRCPAAVSACRISRPELKAVGADRRLRCPVSAAEWENRHVEP
jgi:oligopeptide/dipeptide ABC transporter ATP-binding protein